MIEPDLTFKEKINQKVKLVILPFSKLAAIFVVAYTFLHWQLFLLHPTNVKEDVIDTWLPFALPWIPVLIWLRPRLNVMDLKTKKGNLRFGLYMIASLTITVPTIIAQFYIKTATGKLTALETIKDIDAYEPTKYYTLKAHYADKQNICFKNTATVTGKNKTNLNFHIYIACPLYDTAPRIDHYVVTKRYAADDIKVEADTSSGSTSDSSTIIPQKKDDDEVDVQVFKKGATLPKAWLCFVYGIQISNKLSKAAEDAKWMAFYNETYKDFYAKNIDSFVYLERLGNNDRRKFYRAAITNCRAPVDITQTIILIPKNEAFDKRNGDKLVWVFVSFAIGAILFLMIIVNRKIKEEKNF